MVDRFQKSREGIDAILVAGIAAYEDADRIWRNQVPWFDAGRDHDLPRWYASKIIEAVTPLILDTDNG